jgi:multicomponent Na+:H+ antiporter subunit D
MINQIGFMVVGIGLGEGMGVNGAVAHAFNDVFFKGLLFMSMGAVLFRTGRIKGSELGGLYKSMPWTTGFCLVGAASISASPLFSGFVSKSMVMVAAADGGYISVWLMLLFASAGVFHHAGIKIPFFAFFGHDSGLRPKEAPGNMLVAMGLAAAFCIGIGCNPGLLYALLPFEVDYQPYTATHVLTQLQILFFSAMAFTVLMLTKVYPPELHSTNLDIDWLWRRALPALFRPPLRLAWHFWTTLTANGRLLVRITLTGVHHLHGPEGVFARTWSTGSIALCAVVVLGSYLALYFFS